MIKSNCNDVFKKIRHPQKITLAVTKGLNSKFNLITLEWFMRTSINPPMYAISIGHSRYSYKCLRKNRFFNLCFPSKEMRDCVLLSGSKSGKDINKLESCNITWFNGKLVGFPIIREAVANFECQIITQVKTGDHTIYVGEIKHAFYNSDKELLLSSDL